MTEPPDTIDKAMWHIATDAAKERAARSARWAELHRQGNASRTKQEADRIAAEMDALLALPTLPPYPPLTLSED